MEKNSFEQFCINYANEKLQSEFCEKVFKVEQATYEREGITWSTIDFTDNQPCIDIIESKSGVIGLLDDECRVPNGSDKGYCEKLIKLNNPYIVAVRFKNESFCIKHYAYDVEYASDGFLEKNRDQVSIDLLRIVSGSSDAFTAQLLSNSPHIVAPNRASTANSFKASLTALMGMIRSTDTHYVRCIKPNEQKKPALFDGPHVLQQLQACGILETIRISAAGYPGRWSFKEFATRYILFADPPLVIARC
jgi:myosin-5